MDYMGINYLLILLNIISYNSSYYQFNNNFNIKSCLFKESRKDMKIMVITELWITKTKTENCEIPAKI